MIWWHGGPAIKGVMILPSVETGVSRSGDPAGVFITTEKGLATSYAATVNGWVYMVQPIGEIRQDELSILPAGQACSCERARIIKRYKVSAADCVRYTQVINEAQRALL